MRRKEKKQNESAIVEGTDYSAIQPWGRNSTMPEGAIQVNDYTAYLNLIGKWADGSLDSTLVVIGGAGIGKTHQARLCLDEHIGEGNYCYCKGRVSKYGLYMDLADHIDAPVVLDDVDEMMGDATVTGLLKMLLETNPTKIIQWKTGATMNPESNIPPEIRTKSRTMILANELKLVSKNFGAVLDRSTIIVFTPSAKAVHEYVGQWFDVKKHKDVYEYVGERINFVASPSCRFYYKALTWKVAGLPWQKFLDDGMKPSHSKETLLLQLLDKYKNERAQVTMAMKEYCSITDDSTQAFYAMRTAIANQRGEVSKKSKATSEAMRLYHAKKRALKK